MTLTLILISAVIVLAGISFFAIKGNIQKSKIINQAGKVRKKEEQANQSRAKIEEKHNEKNNEILNSGAVDHNVLPDGSRVEHNHSFRQLCTEDCPAYHR